MASSENKEGSLLREGRKKDFFRFYIVKYYKIKSTPKQNAGFAGARTCWEIERPVNIADGFFLFIVRLKISITPELF